MDRYDFNPTVSWGAILAGGFTAAAVSLIVVAFGVGVGLSVVSPWNGEGFQPRLRAGQPACSLLSSP